MRTAPSDRRTRDLVQGIALGIALGALLVVGRPATAAVIAVPADQPTIQRAVDAAVAGDVVRVSPGIYRERVRITGARGGLVIEAADSADPPVVQGARSTSTDGIQVDGVDGVVLRALRVVDANTGVRLVRANDTVVEQVRLENDGLGIRIANCHGATVRGTTIDGTRGRQGILVESAPDTTIEDTTVHAPRREGIAVRNAPGAMLRRVTVDGSHGSDGILVYRSNGSHVEDVATTGNARNGLRASSSLDLALVRTAANGNGSAGLRIERSSPFDDVADVMSLGNTATGNRDRDIVVVPFRCNQSRCPTTTFPTTTSTTGSTTTTIGSTTTTTTPPPLAEGAWRFYVRIATSDPFPRNVDVPAHSTDAPLAVMIRADHLAAFRPGDQVTGSEIAALGGDTLDRLTAAVDAYLVAHPEDYAGFQAVVELRWAKRVAP